MTPIGKDITKRNEIACSSMSYTPFFILININANQNSDYLKSFRKGHKKNMEASKKR